MKTIAPNTLKLKLRFIIALAVYVVIVHMLAACTLLRLWRRLTGATPPVRLGDDPDIDSDSGGNQSKSALAHQAAENLLLEFKADDLKELCRARGLPVCGKKSELANRFLSSQSRATNRQLSYIGRLSKQNHHLKLSTSDLDSVEKASAWILNASR